MPVKPVNSNKPGKSATEEAVIFVIPVQPRCKFNF